MPIPNENSPKQTDPTPPLDESDSPTDHTVFEQPSTLDTVADLKEAGIGDESSKRDRRLQQVPIKVAIGDNDSMHIVLGADASSYVTRIADKLLAIEEGRVATLNLISRGRLIQLEIVDSESQQALSLERESFLYNAITVKKTGSEVELVSLLSTSGEQRTPSSVARKAKLADLRVQSRSDGDTRDEAIDRMLAQKAQTREQNRVRENLVYEAKFTIGLMDSRTEMTSNDHMLQSVQASLEKLDQSLSQLIEAEKGEATKGNKDWIESYAALLTLVQNGVATVCPHVDALLLVFMPDVIPAHMKELANDTGLKAFLDTIESAGTLSFGRAAKERKALQPLVKGIRAKLA